MQIKTRILIVMVPAMALLLGVVFATGWQSVMRWESRYNQVLLESQRIVWDKLQQDNFERLEDIAHTLLASPALQEDTDLRPGERLHRLLERITDTAPPGLRIDILSPQATLIDSTDSHPVPHPLAQEAWIDRAAEQERVIRTLNQTAPHEYMWVVLVAFNGGVVAVGQDVLPQLQNLTAYLGGDVYVANMRGHPSVEYRPGKLSAERVTVPVRQPHSRIALAPDANAQQRALQVLSQPLRNTDQRIIGALVWVLDTDKTYRDDQRFNAIALGFTLGFALVLIGATVLYLHHATRPLKRAVRVLNALATGRTDLALDEADEEGEDEAGEIARGVVAIRAELLALETLRQERLRIGVQQERLIRDQLRHLADNIDPAAREEILTALDAPVDAEADAAHGGGPASPRHHLADLASILARMSGLVSSQQQQLIRLLHDLQEAMKTQAQFASLQQELEIARLMQLSILPRTAPATQEVAVHATMIPAKEVGGDFYDYFFIDSDHLAVVVADVSGKGVPAAFFMAISRTLLKSNAMHLRDAGKTIEALNDQLCAENDQMMFVTAFYGVLHLPSGRFTYVNAGHNPPIKRLGAQAHWFPSGDNMALAVLEGQTYKTGEVVLSQGETIVLYTDGVTEATQHDGTLFGEAALMETIRSQPPGAHADGIPDGVLQAVRAFEAGAAQADDITIVALTYRGVPA